MDMAWNLENLEQTLLIGSTLVEGSTLSEAEASQVLAGRTVQGHPVTEIHELLNYRAAVEWLMKQLAQTPYLSQDLVLAFHQRLFTGFPGNRGGWKSHQNYTYLSNGARFDYAHPSIVEKTMSDWIQRFNAVSDETRAVETAARLYYEFQFIHPFDDGNGRIGRILVAYWLHWKAKLSLNFHLKDKTEHLSALEKANQDDFGPLLAFFKKRTSKERGK